MTVNKTQLNGSFSYFCAFFLVLKCENLKDLGVKCLFICDTGSGKMDVLGHQRAIKFVDTQGLAPQFYSYVNGDGTFQHSVYNFNTQ